jgi:hypothetical protein
MKKKLAQQVIAYFCLIATTGYCIIFITSYLEIITHND